MTRRLRRRARAQHRQPRVAPPTATSCASPSPALHPVPAQSLRASSRWLRATVCECSGGVAYGLRAAPRRAHGVAPCLTPLYGIAGPLLRLVSRPALPPQRLPSCSAVRQTSQWPTATPQSPPPQSTTRGAPLRRARAPRKRSRGRDSTAWLWRWRNWGDFSSSAVADGAATTARGRPHHDAGAPRTCPPMACGAAVERPHPLQRGIDARSSSCSRIPAAPRKQR